MLANRYFQGYFKKPMVVVIFAILTIEGGHHPPLGRPSTLWGCPRVRVMVPLPSTNPTPFSSFWQPILFSQGAKRDTPQLVIMQEKLMLKGISPLLPVKRCQSITEKVCFRNNFPDSVRYSPRVILHPPRRHFSGHCPLRLSKYGSDVCSYFSIMRFIM